MSYEHMGILQLSCESGCACEPLFLDCNTPKVFSGAETMTMNITSFTGKGCIIKATNVARADGKDGSKVKLLGFYLKTHTSSTEMFKQAEASMYHHKNPGDF